VAGTRTPSKRVTYAGVPPSASASLFMDMEFLLCWVIQDEAYQGNDLLPIPIDRRRST
jgi:hypothetical protein